MTRAAKVRADTTLVARGLADSRARAQALIMAGLVSCCNRALQAASRRRAHARPS
jgi:23S rRNA (cytidine1920-2'-O)/16S rRNA (cytidine1409-2'-O)-methyltransferase